MSFQSFSRKSSHPYYVPKTSLIHSTEGVFVVKVRDNAAQWVGIRKGSPVDSLIEVFGPVSEGDRIVKSAHDELRDGQVLAIYNAETQGRRGNAEGTQRLQVTSSR